MEKTNSKCKQSSLIYFLSEVVTFPFLLSNIPSSQVSLYLKKILSYCLFFSPSQLNSKKSTGFSTVLGVTAVKQSTNIICWRKYWRNKDKGQIQQIICKFIIWKLTPFLFCWGSFCSFVFFFHVWFEAIQLPLKEKKNWAGISTDFCNSTFGVLKLLVNENRGSTIENRPLLGSFLLIRIQSALQTR